MKTFILFVLIVTIGVFTNVYAQVYTPTKTATVSCDAGKNQRVFANCAEADAYARTAPCVGRTWTCNGYYTKASSSKSSASSSSIKPIPEIGKPIFTFDSLTTDKNSILSWNDSTYTTIATTASRTGEPSKVLQFNYQAGEFWSEQRFTLAKAYPEIWIKYWLQVPANFKHNQIKGATNNKLFALWMDDYSSKGKGPTVIWEFWPNGKNGSDLAVHYSQGGNTAAGEHLQLKPFISYPADQGRWMQIALHVKSGKQGVIEFYRRWDGEPTLTKLQSLTNVNLPAPANGPAGWKAGYFMGWSNPSYVATTLWNLDDVEISESVATE